MDIPMRRKERAMNSEDAQELLDKAQVGRLGTSWRGEPYIVPLNFVYYKRKIYFHCAKEGKKLEYIANNPRVCFEVDDLIRIEVKKKPCNSKTYYRSVVAFGEAKLLEAADDKIEALKRLTRKYAKEHIESTFDQTELKINIVELQIESITGKQSLSNPTAFTYGAL